MDATTADALEEIRDQLAVIAAAVNAPWELQWERLPGGLLAILGEIDQRLKALLATYQPPDLPADQ